MRNLNIILLSVLFAFGFGGMQQAFGQCMNDTWAPVIVYPSQDINVELDPCDLGFAAVVFFEVTVTDDCDGDYVPSNDGTVIPGAEFSVTVDNGVIIALGSREGFAGVFAPGVYRVLIEAEDAAGNVRREDFFVVVTQDGPTPTNLSCNGAVNVTLNADCQRLVSPDMVLEGEFGCANESDFRVNIVNDDDPSNGNILDGYGQFIYEVIYVNPDLTGPPQVGTTGEDMVSSGFTGPYAPANWTTNTYLPGFVNFSATSLQMGTNSDAYFGEETASTAITIPGFGGSLPGCSVDISFSYNFETNDFVSGSTFELWGYAVDPALGNLQQVLKVVVSDGVDLGQLQGTINLTLNVGQVLILGWVSTSGFVPAGASVIISNWTATYPGICYPQPPLPLPGWEDCEGIIIGEDKNGYCSQTGGQCPGDIQAPIIVRPSQDIYVALDPCDQNPAVVIFELTVVDNCDGDHFPAAPGDPVLPGSEYTVTVYTPYTSGFTLDFSGEGNNGEIFVGAFAPGAYQIVITAEDAAGNISQEDFFIVVTQDAAPPTNLSCSNNTVNATLDANCQRFITSDMVLEGDFGCAGESDFIVNILDDEDPSNGPILDGHGEFTYEVVYVGYTPLEGWQDCEGTINGEDKARPTVACQPAVAQLNAAGAASITATDVFDAAGSSDNCGTVTPQSVSPGSFTCENLGPNTVTLTVNDGNGNTSTCLAIVTIEDPNGYCSQPVCFDLEVGQLNAYIRGLGLSSTTERALTRRLDLAVSKFCTGTSAATIIDYLENIIGYVQYHRGGSIPVAAADYILAEVQGLIYALDAGTAQCCPDEDRGPLPGIPGQVTGKAYMLEAFPNPSNGQAVIRFYLPQAGQASLELFNLQGQRVRILESVLLDAGSHEQAWDGKGDNGQALAPGAYLLRLRTEDAVLVRKVSLVR